MELKMKVKIYIPYTIDPVTGGKEVYFNEVVSAAPQKSKLRPSLYSAQWEEIEVDLPNVIEVPEITVADASFTTATYVNGKLYDWGYDGVDWDEDLGGKWPEVLPDSLVPESPSKQNQKLTLTTLGVKNKQEDSNED
jgi:hypothetical protein